MTEQFGNALRALREDAGLTLVELARDSGIARSHLYRLEHGETSQPNVDTLNALADALDQSREQFYEVTWKTTGTGPGLPSLSTYLSLKYELAPAQITAMIKSYRKHVGSAPRVRRDQQETPA